MDRTDETIDAPDGAVAPFGDTIASDGGDARATRRPPADPDRGALIGRYVVLSKLGAGAMGVVLAAYDPELNRRVAVKLLRARASRDQEAARARLKREAQALAKLNHPNVVGVHDVGVHHGQVFMAMEFVEGQTLGDWIEAGRRPWREVVRVFEASGRGLLAAHKEGLIHRDFKPDNVMLGDDGGVRVMDFGLACAEEEEAAPVDLEESGSPTQPTLDTPRTRAGAMMGTPAYMSPEAFWRREVTARSDQFSYCVALHEALYAVRPFGGENLNALALAVTEGKLVEPPRGVDVPAWLRRVVLRGLSVEPGGRYADMAALLAELGAGEARRRRSRILVGTAALAFAGASVVGFEHWDERKRTDACIADGDRIDEIWNGGVRVELRDGLLATGVNYAVTTAENVAPYFDAQAEALRTAQTGACLDAHVRGTWTEDLLNRATWCLDERRMELEALVEELSGADETSVRKAVTAASGLSQVDTCLDEHRLLQSAPPNDAASVNLVRRAVWAASARESAGRYEEGLRLARDALVEAERVGWPALMASARGRVGWLLSRTGEYEAAETALEEAYFEAAEHGASAASAASALGLLYTVGALQARHDDGRRWARHAAVALTGLGEPRDSLRRAAVDVHLATIHRATGAYAESKALNERALAVYEKALGPEHPRVATALNNLANDHWAAGEYPEATELYRRALAIREKTLGPEHPYMADSLSNLAGVHQTTGAYAEAKLLHERALAICEKALGPEHPRVAASLNNLAAVHSATGAYTEAKAMHERALAIREKALGPEHPDVAMSLDNVGLTHQAAGAYAEAKPLHERALAIREKALSPEHASVGDSLNNLASAHEGMGAYAEARALHERALAIREKTLGPEHPNVAISLTNLAFAQQATGAYGEAVPLYERAVTIFERALGPEHPHLAYPLDGMAGIALEQRRPADAIAYAERAVAVRTSGDAPVESVAGSRFILSRALWVAPASAGRDRPRARALAKQARDAYREAGGKDDELAKVEQWLSEKGE